MTPAEVEQQQPGGTDTLVDRYWSQHTVRERPFESARESGEYLEWRFSEYPLFREFAGLWGRHDGETVLDYGCGPGNDVTGFLIHTQARKVIGVDVSSKALELARRRVALHDVERDRLQLLQVSDASPEIPLATGSVDYFQSLGVLHHTTDPASILRELRRVLRPDGLGRVMVYNRDSIWLHLYTAYIVTVLQERFGEMSVDDAFERTTDGEDCPIAHCYRPQEFIDICAAAGFDSEFVGGYLSTHELDCLKEHAGRARRAWLKLGREHRRFLSELEADAEGYPMWHGKHCGVGGVYVLRPGPESQA